MQAGFLAIVSRGVGNEEWNGHRVNVTIWLETSESRLCLGWLRSPRCNTYKTIKNLRQTKDGKRESGIQRENRKSVFVILHLPLKVNHPAVASCRSRNVTPRRTGRLKWSADRVSTQPGACDSLYRHRIYPRSFSCLCTVISLFVCVFTHWIFTCINTEVDGFTFVSSILNVD